MDDKEVKTMIKIKYNGKYPTTCMGTLKIYEDDKLIYNKQNCCHSTGSAYVDSSGNEHVEKGELLWKDTEATKFKEEIQYAVKQKLSKYFVCCGGCI